MAGVEITLSGLGGRSNVTSGRTGEFRVPRLRAGVYTITVKHPDYHLDEPVRVIVSGPTQFNLKKFSEFRTVDDLLHWASNQAAEGIGKIRPVILAENGKTRFIIPGDADYPG